MAAAPAHPLLKTLVKQRSKLKVVDKYGAMQLPAPIAPTMATVGIGNLRSGMRDDPDLDRSYGGSLVQHTPIAYTSDGGGIRAKKHGRMGTSDKIATHSTALGITRDPLNLSVLMSQRDPVASVAVRGIVPAVITKTFPEAIGGQALAKLDPSEPTQFFKHASFVQDTEGGSTFAMTTQPDQTSHGVYLPFGNFNEKYKHAFPLHMNSINFGVLQSNALIRRGTIPVPAAVSKAKDAATAVAVLETAVSAADADAAAAKLKAAKATAEAEKNALVAAAKAKKAAAKKAAREAKEAIDAEKKAERDRANAADVAAVTGGVPTVDVPGGPRVGKGLAASTAKPIDTLRRAKPKTLKRGGGVKPGP
jgi:hypothetical protein